MSPVRSGAVNIHQNCASGIEERLKLQLTASCWEKTRSTLVVGTEEHDLMYPPVDQSPQRVSHGAWKDTRCQISDGLVVEVVPGHMGVTAPKTSLKKYGITGRSVMNWALVVISGLPSGKRRDI